MILDRKIGIFQTANRGAETSPLTYARIAGFLYLILALLGGFAEFFVRQSIIVQGNVVATVNNILASESLFRLGVMSDLIGQTVFIFLVLPLYVLLKPVNKNIALLMVVSALVGVPIAMINLINQSAALLLLDGAEYLTVFTSDQLQAQAMFFLDLQRHGVSIAQIFWGLWLLPLGYLVFRSGFLPRFLGILLIVGGLGYVIDVFTFFLFPNFDTTLSEFTFLGELLLILWLLIKGINVEQWQKLSVGSEVADGVETA